MVFYYSEGEKRFIYSEEFAKKLFFLFQPSFIKSRMPTDPPDGLEAMPSKLATYILACIHTEENLVEGAPARARDS